MFRLHCNKCGQTHASDSNRSFVISRCQHIVCVVCIAAKKKCCPVCQRPLQGTPINESMPKDVARYFQDPRPLLDLWKKICKFQHDQNASDNLHFWQRQQKAFTVKRELDGLHKLSTELARKNEKEKQKIQKMRDYITFYERALENKEDISSQVFGLQTSSIPSSISTDNTSSDDNIRTQMNITLSSSDSGNTLKPRPKRRRSTGSIENESFFKF